MKLSVIIVNYNVKYFLEQCLDAVLKATKKIDTEVFVVDNHSSDDSVSYLKFRFPWVIFIENQDNPGFSKANNQAILQATGEYILLLNPDTVVGEETFVRCCQFMDSHPQAGGLGVKMINGSGRFLPESKRGFPSPWNSFCKMTGLSRIFPHSSFFAKYHLHYLDKNEIHEVEVLAGAFMLMRKTVLDQVGLLDEAFFMYGEDIDLSYRITLSGYKNYYFPERILHYKGESTRKDLHYVKVFHDAMLIFFKKHYPQYRFFFRFIVNTSIYFRAFFSFIGKMIPRKKRKLNEIDSPVLILGGEEEQKVVRSLLEIDCVCVDPEQFEPDLNFKKFREVIFCANRMEYQNIVALMDTKRKQVPGYWIFHPDFGTLIASNRIITC